jgi:hypothetical protein
MQTVADSSRLRDYSEKLGCFCLPFERRCSFERSSVKEFVNGRAVTLNLDRGAIWSLVGEMVVVKVKALILASAMGVAALAVSTSAFAGDQRNNPSNAAANIAAANAGAPQAPWYERFTFGSEMRDGANAWVPRGEARTSAVVDSRNRWGVTFGVNQEARAALAPRAGQSTARASAGAFFQVSPKFRVGGAVSVPDEDLGLSANRDKKKAREPGVKVESAFRF